MLAAVSSSGIKMGYTSVTVTRKVDGGSVGSKSVWPTKVFCELGMLTDFILRELVERGWTVLRKQLGRERINKQSGE